MISDGAEYCIKENDFYLDKQEQTHHKNLSSKLQSVEVKIHFR